MFGVAPLKLTRLTGSKMSSLVNCFCWACVGSEKNDKKKRANNILPDLFKQLLSWIVWPLNYDARGVIFLIKGVSKANRIAAINVIAAKVPNARVNTAASFPAKKRVVSPAI